MTDLETLLKRLDHDVAVPAPDAQREAELMHAFDTTGDRRRSRVSMVGGMALAATVAIVTVAGLTLFRNAGVGIVLDSPAPEAATGEFQLWPGAESLPQFESGQLVRMDLPDAGVRADVLIGQDGLPRAYRVVINTPVETRP